jgi:hypothetical protein
MSWQAKLGITFTNAADLIENGTNGIHRVLTDAGWTLLDNLISTSGQTDRVYSSPGESGNEAIYIRISQTAASQKIRFGLYTFWDAVGHAGYNAVRGGYTSPTEAPQYFATKATQFVGWVVANKNGLTLVMRYDSPTEYGTVYVGLLETRYVPTDRSGRTALTAGVTIAAAGTTVLAVGSSANIKAGQKLFVINQLAGANVGNLVRCTVTTTGAGTITVTNDSATATAFDAGALVGYDPQPVCVMGLGRDRTGWTAPYISKGATFLYGISTLMMTGTTQTYDTQYWYGASWTTRYTWCGGIAPASAPVDLSALFGASSIYERMGPDIDSKWAVDPMMLVGGMTNDALNSDVNIRGSTERVAAVHQSVTLAAEDVLSVGSAQWLVVKWGASNYYDAWAVKIAE